MTKTSTGLLAATGFGLLIATGPVQAAPVLPLPQKAFTDEAPAARLQLVHGRKVRGRHCRNAWHPRRGWHRHPRACRYKYRNRWRPSPRWHRDKGCYFYRGGLHCRFF